MHDVRSDHHGSRAAHPRRRYDLVVAVDRIGRGPDADSAGSRDRAGPRRYPASTPRRSRASRSLADALASLVNGRLTWIVHVTAIITPCVLPQVVGEVTSSVTVTTLPEVYLLPKARWNDGRFRPGVDGPSRGPG
jgi:hypothetical protein